MSVSTEIQTLEARARRIAKRHDHWIAKAHGRLHINNHGEFQLLDLNNIVVGGVNFDMTPEQVIEYFKDLEAAVNA